jgi:FAD/FMN-containing dehydrogenase
VSELVRWARRRGLPVRVLGAGHSIPPAIETTARREARPGAGVDLVLDRCAGVTFDDERRRATVEAGCRFGADPRDRSGRATAEAGLCWQLERRGWALPNLAGLSQQTVAGFLMTGSAGGSRRRSLDRAVAGLRLVGADGEVHEYTRERDPDLLDAAGVSLGLLGVVTSVTFDCEERYDVAGEEAIARAGGGPVDLFSGDEADAFLAAEEYARVLWWPQPGVDRVAVWRAGRVPGPPSPTPTPYRPLPEVAGSTLPAQAAAALVLAAAGRSRRFGRALAAAYDLLIPEDKGPPRRFRDAWWRALPMDDGIDEALLPVEFCELWLPREATGEALRRLRAHFERGGFAATGSFCVEVYAGAESPFWLSPGHGRESTRLNLFRSPRDPGDAGREWFPRFWELLEDLDVRAHWGKHLHPDPARSAARFAASYERLGDFLELRAELDPDGAFLSDYWRAQLGIAPPPRRARPAAARGELVPVAGGSGVATPPVTGVRRPRWPLLFRFAPTDPTYAERAPYVIDTQVVMDASPDTIYEEFVELGEARSWLDHFRRVDQIQRPGGEPAAAGTDEHVFDEVFSFMTLRVRTLRESEPGRRWIASVDGCSMPLAREMYEEVALEPQPDGMTLFRWRVWYEPLPAMRPFHPLVRAFFVRMFRRSAERLGRHVATRR